MPKLAALSPLILVIACSPPALTRTARDGNARALLDALERERSGDGLDEAELKAAARGQLEGEIARSQGPRGAELVSSLSSCAGPLESALAERAKTHDTVGGEAALLLTERGSWCSSSDFSRDELGSWRAVAAFDADGDSQAEGELRRAFFLDGDERVRRAALDAAARARDERDVAPLLEAARLDPDPLARSRAVRALGARGGAELVEKLHERFVAVDETERLTYLEAWAQPASFESGGRERLLLVARREGGMVALAAASTFLRVEPEETDAEARGEMLARLLQAARSGTRAERRFALGELPAEDAETARALRAAAEDADVEVALIATVRLAGRSEDRDIAEKRLLVWSSRPDSIGRQARAALAVHGSLAILPALREAARSDDPTSRAISGRALIRLGRATEGYFLLGDPDPRVRRGFACSLLQRR